ncbi:N-formylglutamate amidohydrolase [Pelagibius litoralis]|uniref:N-formylglutamate amidohydrolase n=1 Tax=Pelagibius litoralis TaxID=374515 RepID=A0A967F052_9PROT|nr:N-formylglutamate amidohydrolase [Pelagibius litoralis]NIA70640.1 N-formylglutamate amidohydrolase [Pelagibius litoralis]
MTADLGFEETRQPFDLDAFDFFEGAKPTPLLIDSPHSGRVYPGDFSTAVPGTVLRGAEDWQVDVLFADAPAAGASLLTARFPRAYIDPNRRLDDVDPALLDGPWPKPLNPGPKTALGIGLFRARTGDGEPLLDAPLSVAALQARIERCWKPYRRALQEKLDRIHVRHGAVWHLNVHSMKSVGTAITPDGPGAQRPDMVLGDLEGQSCDPAFTAFVAERLRGFGYSVAVNDPYKGAEIVKTHGRPSENRNSLQIEMKRALYMDEATITATEGFEPLRANLRNLVADLVQWVGNQTT